MRKTLFALLILFAALPVGAAKVLVDYDHDIDFSKFSTFALVPGTPAGELTQGRIDDALRAQLEAEGLAEVAENEADLLVSTHAATEAQAKKKGGNVSVGVGKRGKRGQVGLSTGGGGRLKTVESGSLVVDLVNAGTEKLVWRATASGTLKGDPQKIEQKMKKALTEAFESYPPQP